MENRTQQRSENISADSNNDIGKLTKGKRQLKDIQNLAEFIEYAYSRKGQRLSLKPKVKKAIRANPSLNGESRRCLLALAKEDKLLAVPRRILLAVRNIKTPLILKTEVGNFIRDVLNAHPAFAIPEIKGDLDHIQEPTSALEAMSKHDYSKLSEFDKDKLLKPKDYEVLRVNAIYSLALWLFEKRELSLERINQHLFDTLWQPVALTANDETAQLQILTDISIRDLAGVGIACQSFKQQADRQARRAEAAKQSEESALEQQRSLKDSCEELQRVIKQRDQKIAELREILKTEKQAHEYTQIHLNDDLENLRSRLLRRLKAEVRLLDEGLHALRRNPPKLRVMEDHAERALDGLKKEIKELDIG